MAIKKMCMSSRSKIFSLFPCFLVVYSFSVNLSNDLFLPALPIITQDLATTINHVQFTITMWLAGNTIVQLFVGPLADHYGRRWALFVGGALYLAATLGCAFSSSIISLLLFRFLQGGGVCSMVIAGYSSIHDLYLEKEAIHIISAMGCAALLAPALGPVCGGFLLHIGSWRLLFYVLFISAFLTLIPLWFSMPESHSFEKNSLIKAFANYKLALTHPAFVVLSIAHGFLYGVIAGWITASPFLMIEKFRLTPLKFGAWQIPVFGCYVLGAQLVKPILRHIKKNELIFGGLFLTLLGGSLLLFWVITFGGNTLAFVLPLSCYSLGFGFVAAPLNHKIMQISGVPKGCSLALFYVFMMTIGTISSFVLTLFNENSLTISILLGGCILAATVLMLLYYRSTGSQSRN